MPAIPRVTPCTTAGPTMPTKSFIRSPLPRRLLAFLAALGATTAHAVGLGELISQSSIGQALRIEVQLSGSPPERADGCVRLVPEKGRSADGIPGISRASITFRRSGAGAVAVISDPAPMRHPVLRLRLEETCSGNLQREYLLLLSAPPEIATPVQAPATARTAPTPPTTARRPPPKGYFQWSARGGESLASLASRRHPGDGAAQARFIARVQQANPNRFGPTGASPKTRLTAGTELFLPRREASRATASASLPPATRNNAATPSETPQTPAPATPQKTDQLVVANQQPGPREPLQLARDLAETPGTPSLHEDERDLMRREQKLQATVNEQITAQVDLAQRLRKLEALQAELRAKVTEAPPAAAVPAAIEPPPRAPRPEPSNWPAVVALLVGAVVAGGLWLRRRSRAPSVAKTGKPATVKAVAAPTAPTAPVQMAAPVPSPTPQPAAVPMPQVEAITADEEEAQPDTAPTPEMVALEWEALAPAPLQPDLAFELADDELLAEHDSVIELADIMLSFGRLHGAAETLAEFIRAHPKKSVAPWVKLLGVYRMADMRPEFEALSLRLNQTFNVVSITWDNFDEAMHLTPSRVEDLPHLVEPITRLWGSQEGLAYLDNLLRDNREGTRQGFAMGVADDLLMLISVLDYRLRVAKAQAEELLTA